LNKSGKIQENNVREFSLKFNKIGDDPKKDQHHAGHATFMVFKNLPPEPFGEF
jgi:hypothetical protein